MQMLENFQIIDVLATEQSYKWKFLNILLAYIWDCCQFYF